jgi:hypothetical protein
MPKYQVFRAHWFSSLDPDKMGFDPKVYSRLKFGSNEAARQCGYELADTYFAVHSDTLLSNDCVVIASPYNYVKNAATIMTEHFINRLNSKLVKAAGKTLEYSVIHRKVSYTMDYGFLPKNARKGLLDNDLFYFNQDFVEGKHLIFIDDVKITGTHEDKLREILQRGSMQNDAHFVYYAQFNGTSDPSIEGQLNFAALNSDDDYLKLANDSSHQMIIRAIKFALGREEADFATLTAKMHPRSLVAMYHGALAEGYFKIPTYQANFNTLVEIVNPLL